MKLTEYQTGFIDFLLEAEILSFGEFTLKSGRSSPYFFNVGAFNSGLKLSRLGDFYANALVASGMPCDVLFGPAYKGIPLVSSTAIAMHQRYDIDLSYAYNRKEVKDHGEGGQFVGAPIVGNVVIVDDVMSAGTAIREVMTLLNQTPATVTGILVAIDRQEKGQSELSAIQEVEQHYGVPVMSIINLDDIVEYLASKGSFDAELQLIEAYRL